MGFLESLLRTFAFILISYGIVELGGAMLHKGLITILLEKFSNSFSDIKLTLEEDPFLVEHSSRSIGNVLGVLLIYSGIAGWLANNNIVFGLLAGLAMGAIIWIKGK